MNSKPSKHEFAWLCYKLELDDLCDGGLDEACVKACVPLRRLKRDILISLGDLLRDIARRVERDLVGVHFSGLLFSFGVFIN